VWYNIIIAMVTSTLYLGNEVTMTFNITMFAVELRICALDIPNSAPSLPKNEAGLLMKKFR